MYKVKSTYKVLANKLLQRDSNEEWIDWALEMMMAGFESENLIILAGLTPYSNRFEFDNTVNKTLKELSLDKANHEEIVCGYVYYLISEALDKNISTKKVLQELRDLCQAREYDNKLFPFYLLYYAQDELETLGVQFYWEGADSGNIDAVICNEFYKLKNEFESKGLNSGLT